MLKRQVIGGPGARDLMAFGGQSSYISRIIQSSCLVAYDDYYLLIEITLINSRNYSIGMTFSKSQLTSQLRKKKTRPGIV